MLVFQDPRFELFECCESNGSGVFQPELVQAVLSKLQAKYNVCHHCLDEAFAGVMRKIFEHEFKFGHDVCYGYLVRTRIGSGVAEREHLPGEEMKPPRGRGWLAVSARVLGEATYQKVQSEKQPISANK